MTFNTSDKILDLYLKDTRIDFRNSNEAMRQTMTILSAGGFRSAMCYTGSRGATNLSGLLVLRPNINRMIYAVIYVDGSDCYNIDLVHVGRDKAEHIQQNDGIYVDSLALSFERIYDEYINAEQGGFYRI